MAASQVRAYIEEEWKFEVPTSFIDCVFLMLVFFLVTTRFRSVERALNGNLPKSDAQPGGSPRDIDEIRVTLRWQDSSGAPIEGPVVGARVAILTNNQVCTDLNDLARKLASVSARDNTVSVVIDPRRHVPFRYVLGAVDACARAELRNVVFRSPSAVRGDNSDWWYQ